jgi:hypothetical protein
MIVKVNDCCGCEVCTNCKRGKDYFTYQCDCCGELIVGNAYIVGNDNDKQYCDSCVADKIIEDFTATNSIADQIVIIKCLVNSIEGIEFQLREKDEAYYFTDNDEMLTTEEAIEQGLEILANTYSDSMLANLLDVDFDIAI